MLEDVRPADADDVAGIARVHVDSWRETYRGLMPDAALDALSHETSEAKWRTWSLGGCYVAADGERVVGFAKGGRARDPALADAELYMIYVLRSHHGRGLGRRLFDAVTAYLTRQGFSTMVLWALEGNAPTRGFYEHLGGRPAGRKQADDLPHVAYVFDLPPLVA